MSLSSELMPNREVRITIQECQTHSPDNRHRNRCIAKDVLRSDKVSSALFITQTVVHVIDQTPYNVNRQIISITIDRVDNPRIHEIEDVLVNLNMERLKLREVDSAMASEIQDLITEKGRLLGEIPIEID